MRTSLFDVHRCWCSTHATRTETSRVGGVPINTSKYKIIAISPLLEPSFGRYSIKEFTMIAEDPAQSEKAKKENERMRSGFFSSHNESHHNFSKTRGKVDILQRFLHLLLWLCPRRDCFRYKNTKLNGADPKLANTASQVLGAGARYN